MSRRKQQGVDASSIADIAFILLAFIIIATTLEKESGLPAVLPQKRDNPTEKPPEINEKNILEILINKDDQLLIEGEWDKELEDIVDVVKEFMTNPTDADFLPRMDVVTLDECIKNIAILKANKETAKGAALGIVNDQLKKWETKIEAVKLLGTYRTVNKAATIAIQYDKATTYGKYIGVRDKIMTGLNQLRDQKAMDAFGVTYSSLESIRAEVKTEEDKAKINAIRQVYPQKIIKLPPKEV
jgi:biopolymer transport protein ExbD|tara:strand:+ start:175 stop:900 length:726 start_codon:yes stop_codon:yes gene_type:complete